MVHHRTNRQGGVHSIQMIIRSKKATVIHQSTTHMGSSSGSEYRASESILNRANITGRVGCGRNLYSTSSTTKSGSSSEATTYIRVSTNVLSKSNRTHGEGINRIHTQNKSKIRLGFDLRKANFYAWIYLETVLFLKQFFIAGGVDPHRIQDFKSCYRTPHPP